MSAAADEVIFTDTEPMVARGPAPVSACSRGGGRVSPRSAVQIDVRIPLNLNRVKTCQSKDQDQGKGREEG